MHWLSNPKVRLALIVNGLYFISLLTPTTPQAPPRLFARAFENKDVSVTTPKSTVVFPRLPSPTGPSRAATWVNKSFDQLDVYLKDDLTLVKRPGYRLEFSPTFTTQASSPEAPPTVLLRFVSYSHKTTPPGEVLVRITADGRTLWSTYSRYGGSAASPSDAEADAGDGGEVVDSAAVNLPYEIFFATINARRATVQFDADVVELTPAQIEALRDMHRCLPQSPDGPPPPMPTVNTEKKQILGRAPKTQ
ncbi:MAG TPA: hypothetical protein VF297_19235 [Pyrinomonadaceae bacterium]